MPDRFYIGIGCQHRSEIETDLAQELIGPESVIVPDGHFQNTRSEVAGSNPGIDETLIPLRVTGIDQGFRSSLRQFSVSDFIGLLVLTLFSSQYKNDLVNVITLLNSLRTNKLSCHRSHSHVYVVTYNLTQSDHIKRFMLY